MTGKAAAALKQFLEATRNDCSFEDIAETFQPVSKKELYMAEFQIRKKLKDENWASYGDNLRFWQRKVTWSEAQEVLALN